ncbi:hypothetical protein [Agromyces sp. ZXT2-6]|uniref:hypothetical protein n=1 Tax=Agromyces sp. ZXT2-6 TaxID=3461153 RepID=UPI004054C718
MPQMGAGAIGALSGTVDRARDPILGSLNARSGANLDRLVRQLADAAYPHVEDPVTH